MALLISSALFYGDNATGNMYSTVVDHNERYERISADLLKQRGLYAHVESVSVYAHQYDANLVLLQNDNYSGPFAQVSVDGSAKQQFIIDTFGHIGSALLIVSQKKGELRLSLKDTLLTKWTQYLDQKLAGSAASRQGNPILTWEMFPANVSHLDPNLTYFKVHQPLHININNWPDYSASLTYHIYLYVNGNSKLRASGVRWAQWVENGTKEGKIRDKLRPQVKAGLGEFESILNSQLQAFDGFGNITDVFYLPGNQVTPLGTENITGHTDNDITIVIQK